MFNEFIFKVESRCNLNCSYCYVYNLEDQSWRNQPVAASPEVIRRATERIVEHSLAHDLDGVLISLHGGEPLLRGIRPIHAFVDLVRSVVGDTIELHFSMQTNATLVDEPTAASLADLDIGVGASLDGPPSANDRFRLDRHGRSTSALAESGIQLLRESGALTGILAVIGLDNDPVETYRYLASLGAPSLDFLLPHASWVNPSPGKESSRLGDLGAAAPYGEWLIAAYEEWSNAASPQPAVRIFDDIIHLLLGGELTYESVGLSPARLVVIEADGSIELVDHLKGAAAGATATGCSVFTHSFDEVAEHPGVALRRAGANALHPTCRRCALVDVCGGGLITHRWHEELGFVAPTLYCSDMASLITHIAQDLERRAMAAGAGTLVSQDGG